MVERYTLPNGIPVFVVPTSASPVVSIQAWIRRGSAYETEEEAGISHFLEHSLFKGTRKRKVGEIAAEIESRGGEINAFTSFEETVYYATLASRYFEEGLDVITDAVLNPTFDAEEMLREREVILEEIRRAHDSPYKMVSTNVWKLLFGGTPYGRPVLGYEKTVRKIDHRTLRKYFDRHYHAGSMALFIVGDVEPKRAVAAAKKKLSKAKRRKDVELTRDFRFPVARAPRLELISRDISECQLPLALRAPAVDHASIPSLDLALSAIGQGESSRLYQRLVKEKKLALDAQIGLVATARCGMASLSLVAAPELLEAALKEALAIIAEAAEGGVEEREIERVKSSLESEVIGGKETVEGYARRLGYYYCQFGDPNYEGMYLQQVLSVDKNQATEAVGNAFRATPALSMAHPKEYAPDKKALLAAIAGRPGKRRATVAPTYEPKLTERKPVRFVTKVADSLPVVSVRMLFPGGLREEAPTHLGLANLFQRLWTSGTKSYTSLEIAEKLETLGASLGGYAGRNTMGMSVEFLAKHWPLVKPLLTEILVEPSFPEEEIATEKELALRDIASERDSPGAVCNLNFLEALYGNHPYGRSSLGTVETVSRVGASDLRAFHRDFIHQRQLVVATVGAVDPAQWVEEFGNLCRQLPATGKEPTPHIPFTAPTRVRAITAVKTPLFQTHVLVGFPGAKLSSPDRYALKLLSSSLAGQGGRLFLELRDKQSLAYQVSPMANDSPEGGLFAFYIGCAPEKLDRALTGIRTEIEKVLSAPLDAKELDRAKRYWIGRFELDMQRYASQAMLFGLDECYGIGFKHSLQVAEIVSAVTAEQIRESARRYLTLDKATLSVVHPEALSEEQVITAWEGRTSRPTAPRTSRTADTKARRPASAR